MNETIAADLQADLVGRIEADAMFTTITVLDERKGLTESDVQMAISSMTAKGGRSGVATIVLAPTADDEMPDAVLGPLTWSVTLLVIEDPLVNTDATTGTGYAAMTVARRLHRILKHYRAAGLVHAMVPGRPCISPAKTDFAPVAVEVKFKCQEADAGREYKVGLPTISPAGGTVPQTVTLACATAGAGIYYTLDGTHPHSGNTTATLYTVPFSISTAKVLRVAAFKTGFVGSDINRADFV